VCGNYWKLPFTFWPSMNEVFYFFKWHIKLRWNFGQLENYLVKVSHPHGAHKLEFPLWLGIFLVEVSNPPSHHHMDWHPHRVVDIILMNFYKTYIYITLVEPCKLKHWLVKDTSCFSTQFFGWGLKSTYGHQADVGPCED
jgi:hypothetical protein